MWQLWLHFVKKNKDKITTMEVQGMLLFKLKPIMKNLFFLYCIVSTVISVREFYFKLSSFYFMVKIVYMFSTGFDVRTD